MKIKRIIAIGIVLALIVACFFMLPKEEELYTKPVIEAYRNDDIKFVEVKQGDLIKSANISLSVQNIGEERLSFPYSDFSYKGIYVSEGEHVTKGQVLAELSPDGNEEFIADSSKLVITAPDDGIITYVMDIEDGEQSVSNQYIIIMNKSDKYVISAYTPHWKYFENGKTYKATINGVEKDITSIDPTEVGIDKLADPTEEGASSRIYFSLQEEGLLLYSGMSGNIEIVLEEKEDVLYIPSGAVNMVNGEEIVYVENSDGVRSILTISTGLDTGNLVEVTDGLSLGDKVIVE